MKNVENIIYEIMVYINLNLSEHITLDLLSDKFCYSKFHLHREFKRISGMTLNDYIKRRRIENSLYFLFANIDKDISEIAEYSGFSSCTYSREFKKVFGRTPKEWRNIYKKNNYNENSNICKNYERFICYHNNGIPNEINNISKVEISEMELSSIIFYGDYKKNFQEIWAQIIKYNTVNAPFIGIPINSMAVTNPDNCIYVLGFKTALQTDELTKITVTGGLYLKIRFSGSLNKLGEVYTWIMKYYMPEKNLEYDYGVQLQEFETPIRFDKKDIECNLYIPIKQF